MHICVTGGWRWGARSRWVRSHKIIPGFHGSVTCSMHWLHWEDDTYGVIRLDYNWMDICQFTHYHTNLLPWHLKPITLRSTWIELFHMELSSEDHTRPCLAIFAKSHVRRWNLQSRFAMMWYLLCHARTLGLYDTSSSYNLRKRNDHALCSRTNQGWAAQRYLIR